MPIHLAIVGAGIFARDSHWPALQALSDRFTIAAICSRSAASAEKLAALIPYPVAVVTDYAALLARSDVDAVDLVVPIETLAGYIEAALAAGKHIISEKPATSDVATG